MAPLPKARESAEVGPPQEAELRASRGEERRGEETREEVALPGRGIPDCKSVFDIMV